MAGALARRYLPPELVGAATVGWTVGKGLQSYYRTGSIFEPDGHHDDDDDYRPHRHRVTAFRPRPSTALTLTRHPRRTHFGPFRRSRYKRRIVRQPRRFISYGPTHMSTYRTGWQLPRGGRAYAKRRVPQYAYRRGAKRRRVGAGFTRTSGFYGMFPVMSTHEMKFHDIAFSSITAAVDGWHKGLVPAAGNSLVSIGQGVEENKRVGRLAHIRRIHIRATFQGVASIDQIAAGFRVILFIDTQCNGIEATTAQMFKTDDYFTFNNLANRGRFRVLFDKKYILPPMAADQTAAPNTIFTYSTKNIDINKKVHIPVEYSGTTGAIAEIASNNLMIWFCRLNSGPDIIGVGKARIRFTDT